MKKNILLSVIIVNFVFIIIFSLFLSVSSQTINVKDYIENKFPSIFSFYLSSLEELDQYEKEFIDLLEKLTEEEQEYYAKEVYKNGFSLELLKSIREGKTIQVPTNRPVLPSLPKQKEESIESLPSLIKRIKPSVVIVFAYDDKGEFLQLGSGFFISQNGDVITNYHVLQGASSAEVKTSDGKTYPITYILAGNEQNDIIRLSVDIPSKYVRPLSLSKTIPEVGERIIVYGSPLGLENTVSDGIVSAIRDIPNYGRIIQVTAPISPGSSGSPVLNLRGEVIGIATFQMVEGQNLNFAIPSEKIASFILTKGNKISIPEEMFEQGSKINNDLDYGEIMQIATHFLNNEEYEKGILYLEIAVTKIDIFYLEIAPTKIDILSQKGYRYCDIAYCYEKLGNYFKAIEAYKQAHYFIPDYAHVHFGLGVSYFKIGDKNSALDEYKILKKLDIDLANKLFDFIY